MWLNSLITHTCTYTHAHAHVHAHAHAHTRTHTHTLTYAHTHTHMYSYTLTASKAHIPNISTLLNNRAACHLKNGNIRGCIDDCTKSLELVPVNLKALLRRAQAYEAMEKLVFQVYMRICVFISVTSTKFGIK